MPKFLFFNVPFYGHVLPTLGVVQELVSRGMDVSYYITDEFEELIRSTGAVHQPYQTTLNEIMTSQSNEPLLNESYHVLPQIIERVQAERADYIIYENMCLWGRILTDKLGLPGIRLYTTYASNEQFNMFEYFNKINNRQAPAITYTSEMSKNLTRLCNLYAVQPFDYPDVLLHNEPFNVVFIPRSFHPASDTFDERFLFVGPSIIPRHEETDFDLDELSSQRVLYISLGTLNNTIAGIFDLFMHAFGHQEQQVVLSLGKVIDRSLFGPIPANILLYSYVPQLAILQRTDIFITHGGMNSVLEALRYGVPLVIIAHNREQKITAHRIEELKLGLAIDLESITVYTLRNIVQRIREEPEFHNNARIMQKSILESEGYVGAVDGIFKHLTL